MRLSVMQPYFFPYIGYFQLIAASDQFIIYDNIKYTKKGWINRNRFLLNGTESKFCINLTKDSDFCDVRDRQISQEYQRLKLLRQLHSAYRDAPQFFHIFPIIEKIVNFDSNNLFEYILNSVRCICHLLGITTEILISSEILIDHSLKSEDKLLAFCQKLGATKYINSYGGVDLYSKEIFFGAGVHLAFIKPRPIIYHQFENAFIPNLSIIDVLMFNPISEIAHWINNDYELI
jgi:hypothetical protein